MPLVHIVVGLALAQFLFFCFAVGKARGTYKVAAPATTGNEVFERYFRVQMNTLELLVIFIPSILLFGQYLGAYVATALGVIYLIGRLIYFTSYIKDPKSRSMGYGLSALPVIALLVGAIFGAIRAAVLTL
jgi:glutathione S-transferase